MSNENVELEVLLSPARFTGMSGKMAALVGYILDQPFTSPALAEVQVTADGFLLGRVEGDIGLNEFIGTSEDLERNWSNLLDAAGLTTAQREDAEARYAARITDWREVNA